MSATHEELQIDLDALDEVTAKKKAEEAAKSGSKDSVIIETPPVEKTSVIEPDAGLEKLKAQLESEKSLRLAAERRASEASAGEARARGDVQSTQIDLLTNAISTVRSANDGLKRDYAAAMAAQEYDRVADLQLEMSTNAAKLLALESGKKQLESQPKPQPRAHLDEVEEFAGRCTPLSAAWVRAHPDYVRDQQKNRMMLVAHELALARGLKADTDEYFGSIEETLAIRKAATNGNGNGHDTKHEDADPTKDAAKPIVRTSPPAAPPSRSGNGTGTRPNTVTLTAQEREIAEMNGMTPEDYARNKIALKKEGRLN